ncbi:3-hydroxyisobutyrate dehydrogenase [Balamuthia mandrillaris]
MQRTSFFTRGTNGGAAAVSHHLLSRFALPRRAYSLSASKPPVGFIGLGNMGAHMARNLVKAGYPVVVFDVSSDNTNRFLESANAAKPGHSTAASSPKEVASRSSHIVTMLPSSPHVEEVYCSPENGILAAAKQDSLLIDASTIEPAVARKISARAAEQNIHMIDAPVSGGVVGAEAATLTFMVGGELEAFNKATELLSLMGKNIVHCGGPGNGQAAKLCNNLVLAISMIGVAEGMNLGVQLGLDPKVLAGIFNTSSARCWSSDTYNPVPGIKEGVPSSRNYEGGFGVDLMSKDLNLAINAAHSIKASVPLTGAALQLYNLISSKGAGRKDFSVVYKFLHDK